MKWINAIGLVLQFVAFWLAAPELLGESALKRFRNGLETFLARLPMAIFIVVVLGFSFGFGGLGIWKGLKAAESGMEAGEMTRFYILLGVGMMVYFVFLIFSKKIMRWISEKFSKPLVQKLIQEDRMRKNSLIIGAILFTAGFLFQLAATLI